MSTTLRSYELLLPLRFNDGQPVPDSLIADTLVEVEQRFGSVSAETQVIRGQWRHQGQSYRDELVRVFVDVVWKSLKFPSLSSNVAATSASIRRAGSNPRCFNATNDG